MNESAIVIMARSPEKGEVKTRLGPALDAGERRKLYRRLLDGTVERLGNVKGADTLIAYTPAGTEDYFRRCYGKPCFEQKGEDLGQRLFNALGHLFEMGYEYAAAVGSDIPGLDSRIAGSALAALKRADLVIGPSTDGGYYLIGMREPRSELFKDIPWSTEGVLKSTVTKARQMGMSMEILDILDDIDTPEDLKRLGMI